MPQVRCSCCRPNAFCRVSNDVIFCNRTNADENARANATPTPTPLPLPLPRMPTPGMEYVRTHNLALARNFLMGALSLSPSDPLVLNEVRGHGREVVACPFCWHLLHGTMVWVFRFCWHLMGVSLASDRPRVEHCRCWGSCTVLLFSVAEVSVAELRFAHWFRLYRISCFALWVCTCTVAWSSCGSPPPPVGLHCHDHARHDMPWLSSYHVFLPCPALPCRQLGVVHFATGEYEQARERFAKVLSIVEGLSSQVRRGAAWRTSVRFPFYHLSTYLALS